MAKKITLDNFIKITENDIKEFKQYWEKSHKKDPENFPNSLGEGDWFEQFLIFVDLNDLNEVVFLDPKKMGEE